ncbi:MAG TPA: tetratricopeptide repeat protein [Rhizomicrobium sp.]|nr:tetratricopeptide repeat protein [Rhizomicrobium sp.]
MSQPQIQSFDRQIAMLLQQALTHLKRREFAPAETMLARALQLRPDHADALHLMGQMYWVQGRFAEAEELYRKTLAKEPARAEAHVHLGQVLHAMGRYDEAVAEFREAIRLKLDLTDAHFGLGLALAAKNDLGAAERAYRAGLAQPRRNPQHVAALKHNLGVVLTQQNRHEEALAEIMGAQAISPNLPNADFNRGNTLQMLGRLQEAEMAYLRALSRNPLDLKAHGDLNRLLYRLNRPEFLASYDEALRRHPGFGALHAEKGKFLFLGDRLEDAREAFARALALEPENPAARDGLGSVLTRLGDYEAASREFERLIAAEPGHIDARANYAECLLRAGDAETSAALSEESLKRAPHHQLTLALWGLALRKLGDERERALNDYENFVRVYDLKAPEGHSGTESFNAALDEYLEKIHHDRREHINQTSRNGTKTSGDLFGAGHAIVEQLRARIDEAVADYIAEMKAKDDHPLLARRAAGFGYSGSWSTRLADCGFHTNHIHPTGWISSAYYVAVPDAVKGDAEGQGWIKFGEPSFDAKLGDGARRKVEPRPGLLVLFPSYMWHGTIPFRSGQIRTTVAFDVIPR